MDASSHGPVSNTFLFFIAVRESRSADFDRVAPTTRHMCFQSVGLKLCVSSRRAGSAFRLGSTPAIHVQSVPEPCTISHAASTAAPRSNVVCASSMQKPLFFFKVVVQHHSLITKQLPFASTLSFGKSLEQKRHPLGVSLSSPTRPQSDVQHVVCKPTFCAWFGRLPSEKASPPPIKDARTAYLAA